MIEKRYALKPFEIKNNDVDTYNGSLISSTDMYVIIAINNKYAHSTIVRFMNKYTKYDELMINLKQL